MNCIKNSKSVTVEYNPPVPGHTVGDWNRVLHKEIRVKEDLQHCCPLHFPESATSQVPPPRWNFYFILFCSSPSILVCFCSYAKYFSISLQGFRSGMNYFYWEIAFPALQNLFSERSLGWCGCHTQHGMKQGGLIHASCRFRHRG